MMSTSPTQEFISSNPYKKYIQPSDNNTSEGASVEVGENGSLLLQGHGDLLKTDVVLRSNALTNAAKDSHPGAIRRLSVSTETVLLWLSLVEDGDKQLTHLSARQFARALKVGFSFVPVMPQIVGLLYFLVDLLTSSCNRGFQLVNCGAIWHSCTAFFVEAVLQQVHVVQIPPSSSAFPPNSWTIF